jgi:hypothetical protein
MAHSYEEIRSVAIDILATRAAVRYEPSQYQHLLLGVGEVFERREPPQTSPGRGRTFTMGGGENTLDHADRETFLEVFWDLFRQGVITLGMNDSNREFPFFRLSSYGARIIANQDTYFFHDVSTYEQLIRKEIPSIDDVTLLYLKEAMQAFRVGCLLSATVMLGVATEHTFNLLIETIDGNSTHAATFQSVARERGILRRVNKFKGIIDTQLASLTPEIKEDLDTHFTGILSIIRNFRNQSGHPSGQIIGREQTYVLLQLFIPYCKKMYQLMDHFR